MCFRVGCRMPLTLEAANPLGTSVCTSFSATLGLRAGRSGSMRRIWRAGKPRQARPQPGVQRAGEVAVSVAVAVWDEDPGYRAGEAGAAGTR